MFVVHNGDIEVKRKEAKEIINNLKARKISNKEIQLELEKAGYNKYELLELFSCYLELKDFLGLSLNEYRELGYIGWK